MVLKTVSDMTVIKILLLDTNVRCAPYTDVDDQHGFVKQVSKSDLEPRQVLEQIR